MTVASLSTKNLLINSIQNAGICHIFWGGSPDDIAFVSSISIRATGFSSRGWRRALQHATLDRYIEKTTVVLGAENAAAAAVACTVAAAVSCFAAVFEHAIQRHPSTNIQMSIGSRKLCFCIHT